MKFDALTPSQRSELMGLIRSKNTKPELLVRRALFRCGFRYRIHVKALPGCPDILLPRYNSVVQIRGCFWHGHGCGSARTPSAPKWSEKIERNIRRDAENDEALRKLGWHVLEVWECEVSTKQKSRTSLAALCAMLRSLRGE
jgi:DNA mismatch endonuclease (patch repair protein)